MSRLLTVAALLLACSSANADSFDVASFKAPAGFTKQADAKRVSFTKVSGNAYCILGLYRSAPGLSDVKQDLAADWIELAATPFQISAEPTVTKGPTPKGWTSLQATTTATVQGAKATVSVATFSTGGVRLSVLMLGTDAGCSKAFTTWIRSFKLTAPASTPAAGAAPAAQSTPPSATSNGWTSTPKADWVEVSSAKATVLIHYANAKADAYNSVLADGLRDAWNTLVAPHYKAVKNLALRPIQSFESIGFAEADATDHAGNSVYVVLFKKYVSTGNGRFIEIITRDKRTFEELFGPYHNDEFGWDSLVSLAGHNRFPVSASQLAGTWVSTDFATVSYYYVNGGGQAGASATSIADEFTFDKAGTYSSDHAGASGEVGRAKFSRQQYRGAFTLGTGTITLTKRFQGADETFSAHLEAVKGGYVLVLVDRQGTVKALVKRK